MEEEEEDMVKEELEAKFKEKRENEKSGKFKEGKRVGN